MALSKQERRLDSKVELPHDVHTMNRVAICLLSAPFASLCGYAEAPAGNLTVVRADPANYREKAAALEPGTLLSLDPGRTCSSGDSRMPAPARRTAT